MKKIKFGKISGIYSFKGYLKIDFFISEILSFIKKDSVVCDFNDNELKIDDLKKHNNKLLCKFNGIDTEIDAKNQIGKDLFIERNLIDYELIPEDLTDCDAFLRNGEYFGKVIDIGDYGTGTLIEILKVDKKREMYHFDEEHFKNDCVFELNKIYIDNIYA